MSSNKFEMDYEVYDSVVSVLDQVESFFNIKTIC